MDNIIFTDNKHLAIYEQSYLTLFLVTLVHWRMDWTDARSSVTHQVNIVIIDQFDVDVDLAVDDDHNQ